ncbi:MAG: single-stranded-DNA-specific exonuclease RecJ [Chloroflexaceae bacterium]|nr:single-stranded-DNA-specific exonuclease RecJ [Chloroflexaceae bacterium]
MAIQRKSARQKQWQVRDPAPPDVIEALGGSAILSTLLYQRNLHTPEEAGRFFDDTYPAGLHDPFLMKGMAAASARIARAIAEREPIAVYGDFDVDGVTATALMVQAITAMGGNIRPYIPHREREGYGLNSGAVEQLAAEGVRLLVTVDCGISNVAEVDQARSLGMDVVVTDHHTPPAHLPQALAIVNPKQPGCAYPYKQLVGVGIAFKLIQSLAKQGIRAPLRGRDMLDLVALGTVADLGPLNGENRVLVRVGLDAINLQQRPGLRALIKVAGLRDIDTTGIGFGLAPRLNAAGRVDDAWLALELLLTTDETAAARLAQELNQANRYRQELTEEAQKAARAEAEATSKHTRRIVMIDGEHYPSGVVGLVAGKLVEEWHRPVLLLERGPVESRGSARSIAGFNIIQAMTACGDLFVRFGGHSRAAGFTIETRRLADLETRLLDIAERELPDHLLVPTLWIDAEVALPTVTWELFQELAGLKPFGEGNPQPLLMSRGVQAQEVRAVGTRGQHLKLRLSTNGRRAEDAIAFGLGHLAEPLRKYPWIDVAYTLELNTWNGSHSLQFQVRDFRRATKIAEPGG